jgi:peptidoglycan-associated lipoprotein
VRGVTALWLGAGLVLSALVGGCASPGPPADTTTRSPSATAEIRRGSATVECGFSGSDCEIYDRVLFAYDSTVIAGDHNLKTLDLVAAWLAKYPVPTITVEGHADERGTREYNLALGVRRAIAMRDALIARGVAADRISIISFGKERPAVVGANEAAWAQNRRAVAAVN